MEYLYKGKNLCDAECAIAELTGQSTYKIGYVWNADEVLRLIGVAMKIDEDHVHSDVFPRILPDDVKGICDRCGKLL